MAPRIVGTRVACRACQQASHHYRALQSYSTHKDLPSKEPPEEKTSQIKDNESEEVGAMTRRLQEATEEVLLTGGKAGQRAVEDAGFSDELKEKLLDKIADAKFRKQYAGAFATATINPAAGEGTRSVATASPWLGEESQSDAVLRMLDDGRKPLRKELRGKFKIPEPVDMRIKKAPNASATQRVAKARERASSYSDLGIKDSKGLSDKEKDELKQEFRERFQVGARGMPDTIAGLAALANERIENAISRGQFKNIPRGPGIQRDTRADNPFIDTTEYILNNMIQRQDMVPPWIEKQQEVTKTIHVFRQRLRNDWKRHAARTIASRGGSLLEQMKSAEVYAQSEKLHNPRYRNVDQIVVSTSSTDDPVMAKMRQQVQEAKEAAAQVVAEVIEAEKDGPLPKPFRDPEWEKAEHAYMHLSIENLNSLTRSYNLMAPDLAKKPYFSLQRELLNCFADIAPLLANEIKERATRPASTSLGSFSRPIHKTSVREHLQFSDSSRVFDESPVKAYGFKQLWQDIWKKD